MEQYIPKSALVAEINKCIINAPINNIGHQRVWAYNDVKYIINTLEVKEVDLDEEIELEYNPIDGLSFEEYSGIAKHFFELGVNASNPLTWEDIKLIYNITYEESRNVSLNKGGEISEQEFYQEVLKRFKEKKGKRNENNND